MFVFDSATGVLYENETLGQGERKSAREEVVTMKRVNASHLTRNSMKKN